MRKGKANEVYFSCDVEADGPIPGPHSMLAFGAAAYAEDGQLLGTFEANLTELEGAQADPSTAAWWQTQPEAWEAIRKNTEDPAAAIARFVNWVNSFKGKPVFVGYPACYDFLFLYWYIRRFGLQSPFSHSGLDIKTFAMFLLGTGYRDSTKRNMPKRWFPEGLPHTHRPLDDALEQGALFLNMLREYREQRRQEES
jgi:hypothetical protein